MNVRNGRQPDCEARDVEKRRLEEIVTGGVRLAPPQMLRRYGASARSARARIMTNT